MDKRRPDFDIAKTNAREKPSCFGRDDIVRRTTIYLTHWLSKIESSIFHGIDGLSNEDAAYIHESLFKERPNGG